MVIGIISLVIISLILISAIVKFARTPTLYEQLLKTANLKPTELQVQGSTQKQNYQSLVKTAIAILIQPDTLMQESAKLGISHTAFPKAASPTTFGFITKYFQTQITVDNARENTIAYINIYTINDYGVNHTLDRNVVKNLTQADIDSLRLVAAQAPYSAYGIDVTASDVYRQFQYKDNPDIHVFFIKQRDRDIDKYVKNPHYAENLHTFDKITIINCSTNPECHD